MRHAGESLKELVKRLAALEIVEEVLDRHPCAGEARRTAGWSRLSRKVGASDRMRPPANLPAAAAFPGGDDVESSAMSQV